MTDIDRRTVLKAALTAGLGTAATNGFARSPLARALAGHVAPSGATPKPKRFLRSAGSAAPYTFQGSAQLSETYLLTDNIILGASDQVYPFARPDGSVEALVLSKPTAASVTGTTVSYLWPDPQQPGGWNYAVLSINNVTDLAVALDPSGVVYALMNCHDTGDGTGTATPAGVPAYLPAGSNTWQWPRFSSQPPPDGPLHVCVDQTTGAVSFSSIATTPNSGSPWNQSTGSDQGWPLGTYFLFNPVASLPGWSMSTVAPMSNVPDVPALQDGWIVFNNGAVVAQVYLETDGSTYTLYSNLGFWNAYTGGGPGGTVLYWGSGLMVLGSVGDGSVEYPLLQDCIMLNTDVPWDKGGQADPLSGLTGIAADSFVRRQNNDKSIEYYGLIGDTVGAIPLNPDSPDNPLGLIPFEANMSAFSGVLTGNALSFFGVDSGGVLRYLTRDVTTQVWNNTPVTQASGATSQRAVHWSVSGSVTDAGGAPVVSAPVTVQSSTATGVFQAGSVQLVQAAQDVTLTTDGFGNLAFSAPAVDLTGPTFTVTPVSAPASPAVTVDAAAAVDQYLSGSGSLNGLDPVSGTVLMNAVDSTGAPVFPALQNDPSAADQLAATITSIAQIGLNPTSASALGSTRLLRIGLDHRSLPTLTRSTRPLRHHKQLLGGFWSSVGDDLTSGWQSVKSGASTVVDAGVNWVEGTGEEVGHWAANLTVDVVGLGEQAFGWVVDGIDSAKVIITGFLHKAGAGITGFLDALSAGLIAAFKQAVGIADVVYGWLTTAQGALTTQLTGLQKTVDSDLASVADRLQQEWASTVVPDVTGVLFGTRTTPAQPIPGSVDAKRRSTPAARRLAARKRRRAKTAVGSVELDLLGALLEVTSHGPFSWLWQHLFPSVPTPQPPLFNASDTSTDLFGQFATAFAANRAAFDAAIKKATADLSDLAHSVSSTNNTTAADTQDVLDLVLQLCLAGLALIDTVVDLLLQLVLTLVDDFWSVLTADRSADFPFVSDVLSLAGVNTFTVGYLACLLLAIGVLFVADEMAYAGPFLPSTDASTLRDEQWDFGPLISAVTGVLAIVLGGSSAAGIAETIKNDDDPNFKLPDYFAYTAGITGTLLAVVSFPGNTFTKSDGSTGSGPPFSGLPDVTLPSDSIFGPSAPILLGVAGFAPAFWAVLPAIAAANGKTLPGSAGDDLAVLDTLTGVVLTIFGSLYAWEAGDDVNTKCGAVASFMSDVFSVCAVEGVAEASDSLSYALQLFVTFGASVTVAISSFEEAFS